MNEKLCKEEDSIQIIKIIGLIKNMEEYNSDNKNYWFD